jgi:hypothetical protein
MSAAMPQFQAVGQDEGGPEVVMHTGTPRDCRTKVVARAGLLAQTSGYTVAGMNRREITVVGKRGERTRFWIRKVVDGPTSEQWEQSMNVGKGRLHPADRTYP